MVPLYRDPQFTFRFDDDRVIPRFHLDGAADGQPVAVFRADPKTGTRQDRIATAVVGMGGWVDLPEPIVVRAGQAFAAVLQEASTTVRPLHLQSVPGSFAVCRLSPGEPVPGWATGTEFLSITRTADELSIVCRQDAVPESVRCERDWRCLRVAGSMPFSLVGVVSSLTAPLAEAGVSVFVISTFDTDYLLIKTEQVAAALAALRAAGHRIEAA